MMAGEEKSRLSGETILSLRPSKNRSKDASQTRRSKRNSKTSASEDNHSITHPAPYLVSGQTPGVGGCCWRASCLHLNALCVVSEPLRGIGLSTHTPAPRLARCGVTGVFNRQRRQLGLGAHPILRIASLCCVVGHASGWLSGPIPGKSALCSAHVL